MALEEDLHRGICKVNIEPFVDRLVLPPPNFEAAQEPIKTIKTGHDFWGYL